MQAGQKQSHTEHHEQVDNPGLQGKAWRTQVVHFEESFAIESGADCRSELGHPSWQLKPRARQHARHMPQAAPQRWPLSSPCLFPTSDPQSCRRLPPSTPPHVALPPPLPRTLHCFAPWRREPTSKWQHICHTRNAASTPAQCHAIAAAPFPPPPAATSSH